MTKIQHPLTSIRAIAFDIDGVLSPSTVPCNEDGMPARMANVKDGYAIQLAVKKGLTIAIISGAIAPNMIKRFELLGVKDIFMDVKDKEEVWNQWLQENGLNAEEVAYVGDDVPDLEVLKLAGLPVTPSDACVDAKAIAKYITVAAGGHGVARELIEQILKAQSLWPA